MKKNIFTSVLASLLIFGSLCVYGQSVGISANGSVPNSSALLDVDATGSSPKRGLLIPRVQLTSTTDVATILSPATSLMVYNNASTGTAPNNVKPGYYYSDGAKWVDQIGSTSAFVDVYRAGAMNLSHEVYVKVIFDTEVEDADGLYDNATGKLSLPAGIWKISACEFLCSGGCGNDDAYWWGLYKNGSLYKRSPKLRNYDNPAGLNLDIIVRSNGTDYFETYIFHDNCTSNGTGTTGITDLWMQAVKISN